MPKETVNHYIVLGVSQDATLKEINTAYKQLALKYHPDKTGGGTKSVIVFRKIQEAVEVLRDPDRRKKHDKELGLNSSRRRSLFDDSSTEPGYTGWSPYSGKTYDLSNPWDRYMFSYGLGDHMNPKATPRDGWEELEKEKERINRETEAFLKTQSGLEREREARRREGMAARVRRDEEELAREEQEEKETFGDESFFTAPSQQSFETETDKGKMNVQSSDESSGEGVYMESDSTEEDESDAPEESDDSEEEDTEQISNDDEQSLNAAAGHTTNGSTTQQDEADEGFNPNGLVPFFNHKLHHPNHHYTVEDIRTELYGAVLEPYCGFLEEVRMAFPDAEPIAPGQDPKTCRHLGMWNKRFLIENCEACGRWLPLYTLTCPACAKKACVVCKFLNYGDDDNETYVGQSTAAFLNASMSNWFQDAFYDSTSSSTSNV
ncbi:hypothetical protein VTN00DRAFT_7885 [Thermoascus crustaceus]|uniref:uncharacterized protein n=1 Tax=Thermoascus crustaceus TaxID=5088 RepID=UPI003744063F